MTGCWHCKTGTFLHQPFYDDINVIRITVLWSVFIVNEIHQLKADTVLCARRIYIVIACAATEERANLRILHHRVKALLAQLAHDVAPDAPLTVEDVASKFDRKNSLATVQVTFRGIDKCKFHDIPPLKLCGWMDEQVGIGRCLPHLPFLRTQDCPVTLSVESGMSFPVSRAIHQPGFGKAVAKCKPAFCVLLCTVLGVLCLRQLRGDIVQALICLIHSLILIDIDVFQDAVMDCILVRVLQSMDSLVHGFHAILPSHCSVHSKSSIKIVLVVDRLMDGGDQSPPYSASQTALNTVSNSFSQASAQALHSSSRSHFSSRMSAYAPVGQPVSQSIRYGVSASASSQTASSQVRYFHVLMLDAHCSWKSSNALLQALKPICSLATAVTKSSAQLASSLVSSQVMASLLVQIVSPMFLPILSMSVHTMFSSIHLSKFNVRPACELFYPVFPTLENACGGLFCAFVVLIVAPCVLLVKNFFQKILKNFLACFPLLCSR